MSLKYTLGIASCLTSLLFSANVVAEDRALIVGINAYVENSLNGCRTDAENMYQLIQEVWGYQPSQIKKLIDAQATKQAILTAFDDWLIKDSQQGDRVLFYYSGHGASIPDDNGDEEDGKDEVLCPVNSIPEFKNVIRDDDINARLRKLSGRQVVVITDSCHSGTVTRGFSQANPKKSKAKRFVYPNQPTSKPSTRGVGRPEPANNVVEKLNNVIHYSAVSPTQLALDGGPQGGVFTNTFIKAVGEKAADNNGDGIVTHTEVLNYVQKASQVYCDQTNGCGENGGHLSPQLDANSKWLASDITSKSVTPPPPTESSNDTNIMAQSIAGGNNNTAQLKTQMLPSATFRLGEKMQVKVSTQQPGYLFVLDIDSAGKLTVLFPNEYSKKRNQEGTLQAGQSVTIPDASYGFSFEAQEPTGQGVLLALLIEEDAGFVQDFYQKLQSPTRGFGVAEGFGGIKRTSQVQEALQQLQQQLHQTLLGAEGIGRPIRWSMAEMDYEISR